MYRDLRSEPVTLGKLYRRNALRYVFLVAVMGPLAGLCAWVLRMPDMAMWMVGVGCGLLLRDFAWFLVARNTWPLLGAIID